MNENAHLSRRQFVIGGAMAAAGGIAGCGSSHAAAAMRRSVTSAASTPTATTVTETTAATDTLSRNAYCTLFIGGQWKGPRNADGTPSLAIVDEILAPRAGYATPDYLLTSNGGTTGAKPITLTDLEIEVGERFTHAGVRCGNRIGPYPENMKVSDALSVDELVEQSHQTRAVSDAHGGIYDWLFLDHAWERTPEANNGLNDLQQIIDGMSAAGW